MQPARLITRALLLSAAVALAGIAGCADGGDAPRRDGGRDGSTPVDSGEGTRDAYVPPADAGVDASEPDAWVRPPPVATCEACEEDWQCAEGSFCANLVTGGSACLPGCVADLPECPRSFSCVFDATGTGVSATICAPIGGPCCVDEDGDGYGVGVGCMGPDCNDADPDIHPDTTEICDGIDTNCNATVDEDPNDCMSGRCSDDGDGTYSAVSGATCRSATCEEGTTTDCELFTCSEGGEEGTTCATSCAPDGTDDDRFCIATAHCDSGVCEPDVPDGGTCDEDTDCGAGHCDNGFCCSGGTCCGTTADCPGGGGVARVCENNMTCQGSRGETTCNDSFQCVTVDGIPDDTACNGGTRALDCGFFDPIYCNGTADQTPPTCPTSCTLDSQCVDDAHCSFGQCIPDRPAGAPCGRAQECSDGLFCVDGVCCNSACNGTCEACDVPSAVGTCTPIPAMADYDGECPGFSCNRYFTGFGAGEDVCYPRQPVSDAVAACNGAGACIAPETLCPLQPRSTSWQIDCNNTCQVPVPGTCVDGTPGACMNLDNPADTVSCGQGECQRTVQRCTGGMPTSCVPGTPVAETCNGRDDNCDGTPDNAPPMTMCAPVPGAASYSCNSGSCSFACAPGMWDVDLIYDTGCECSDADDPVSSNTCSSTASTALTFAAGASRTITGVLAPNGDEDWYTIAFPLSGSRLGNQGTPRIRLDPTHPNTGSFVFDLFTNCGGGTGGTGAFCGGGSELPSGRREYAFVDNQSGGATAWSSHSVGWPSLVMIRVRRTSPATVCSQASYRIEVNR